MRENKGGKKNVNKYTWYNMKEGRFLQAIDYEKLNCPLFFEVIALFVRFNDIELKLILWLIRISGEVTTYIGEQKLAGKRDRSGKLNHYANRIGTKAKNIDSICLYQWWAWNGASIQKEN